MIKSDIGIILLTSGAFFDLSAGDGWEAADDNTVFLEDDFIISFIGKLMDFKLAAPEIN